MPLGIFVRGVLIGLLTALIALGMALTYRSNRFINFAQADMGTIPVVLIVMLMTAWGWPYLLAVPTGVVAALVLGAVIELGIIRRFFKAPRLLLTVASLGLSQLLTAIAILLPRLWGADFPLLGQRLAAPFDLQFSIGTVVFDANDLIAMIVAPLALIGLAVFLRWSSVGVAIRASADSADRASLLGVPVKRLQTLVWAVASLMAFIAIFLRAGILGLPVFGALTVGVLLRALAALVLGRMTNLLAIGANAVALGILEVAVGFAASSPLLIDPILAAVIIVALVLTRRGSSRVDEADVSTWRSADDVRPIPDEVGRIPIVRAVKWGTFAVITAAVLIMPQVLSVDRTYKLATVGVYAVLGLSVVVLTGWAGQVSLGQIAFFAIGATVGAKATVDWGLDLSLALIISFVVGGAVAAAVGFPALRRRGFYLAVATLAFSLATTSYFLNSKYFGWVPDGRIPREPLFGKIDLTSTASMYYVVYAVLVGCLFIVKGHPQQPHRSSLHGAARQRTRGRGVRPPRDEGPARRVRVVGSPRGARRVPVRAPAAGHRPRSHRPVPEPVDPHVRHHRRRHRAPRGDHRRGVLDRPRQPAARALADPRERHRRPRRAADPPERRRWPLLSPPRSLAREGRSRARHRGAGSGDIVARGARDCSAAGSGARAGRRRRTDRGGGLMTIPKLRELSVKKWLLGVTGGAAVFPLLVLFGLNAVDELDRTAFAVLLPNIRDAFGLNLTGLLGLIGFVSFVALVLQVPIAAYSDRHNRVRITWIGALAWAFFSLLTGLAWSIVVLGIARAGSGIGKAVVDPTHNSLIADYYDIPVRPRVYSFHRAANAVGAFIGPLTAGLIAAEWGWRWPFIVFTFPTLVFVVLAWRLREPKRGVLERRAMGASEAAAQTEEATPSFAEAWRIVWKIESLRRIWYSLPFLAASLIGFSVLASLLYEQVFDLDERARGIIAACVEPAQLIGLVIGARIATRAMAKGGPAEILKFLSHVAYVVCAALVLFATVPNLYVTIGVNFAVTGLGAILAPGIFAALCLAIPPRARSMGFSVASLWIIPGLLVLPIIGYIGDHLGLRTGMLLMTPVFLIGGLILATTKNTINGDIAEVWRSTAARSEVALRTSARPSEAAARPRSRRLLRQRAGAVRRRLRGRRGQIVALLGTNGAGKSTLLKAISGLVEADRGAVIFDGREITHAPPNEIAASASSGARRPGRVPDPDRRREPPHRVVAAPARQGGGRRGHRSSARAVPGARRPPARPRREPVGRPAADARARHGVPVEAAAADDRRAVSRPRPGGRRAAAAADRSPPQGGHDDHPRRAVGERRAHRRRPGLLHGEGTRSASTARPPSCWTGPTCCGRCSSRARRTDSRRRKRTATSPEAWTSCPHG